MAASPIEDFEWCVRFLKRIFRYCGQDVLAATYRRSILMYSISIWWILVVLFLIITIRDAEHYPASLRYAAAAFCSGVMQVRYFTLLCGCGLHMVEV